MATSGPSAQRAWRSACPGCGAPIEFKSAASTHAVCAYCSTTVVRDGETLKSLGKISAVFEDFSPLQLGTAGQFGGKGFTIVGRLQYRWAQGVWTEWYCLLDAVGSDGAMAWAWLSEDNGQFVWSTPLAGTQAPERASLALNQPLVLGGRSFVVSAITETSLVSAQGELPKIAPLNQPFVVAELRNDSGRVLSVDYSSDTAPTLSLGSGVRLDALKLTNLRSDSEATIKGGRQFACPNCGASLTIKLEKTQSLTCASCSSVIDTSKGIGQEVVSALQSEPIVPGIALGTTGNLSGVDWQVVGYSSMLGKDPSDPDESFGWEEYLLFNKMEGFAFLSDSADGWSLSRPLSGAATLVDGGKRAKYLNTTYNLKEKYLAEVSYVAGEFYWQVKRGARTQVSEFQNGAATLIREQADKEVTWSRGEAKDALLVSRAFSKGAAMPLRADVQPVTRSKMPVFTTLILVVFFFALIIVLATCSNSDCDPNVQNCSSSSGSRGWGGSYGGGSGGGGGHK